jgi:hypothetical protein
MFAKLQKFSANDTEVHLDTEQIKHALSTKQGAITCAAPRYLGEGHQLTYAEIRELAKRMEYYFKCRGLHFIRADGYYGGGHIPNSYIVLDISEPEMIALAQSFSQYSVILFNKNEAKLLYLRGEHKNHFCSAKSWVETPSLTRNDCTAVETKNGPFTFTYNFDHTSLYPL